MNQKDYAKNIELVWDLIEAYQALNHIWPGYILDPADMDRENCFV